MRGSTATVSLGIQSAKLAGYKVVTNFSPKTNAFVRSHGANEVFDYKVMILNVGLRVAR
jgi:NADPH:quinone reductase-like Zn-dependent oxidoreductase